MKSFRISASTALALTLAGLLVVGQPAVIAQSPQSQPLVQAGDVVHLGTIRAPTGAGLGAGPNGMAVEGNQWYFGCGAAGVAMLTLPPLGGTAQVISPCTPFPNIDQVHPTNRNVVTGGVLPWLGRVVTTGWVYYDAGAGAVRSHWTGTNVASLSGPYQLGTDRPGMVGGYMGVIPQEWRALLGGPALTGQCCIPIISRSSFGPSVSVFNPAHVGVQTPVPSTMLIGYPNEHQNLGKWDANPPSTYYGGTDQLGSVSFPAGTRSVLFTGRHGDSWCYGPGTANWALVGTIDLNISQYPFCYDPTDPYQGNHGPPYRPTMWAYDANDLIAVKQGTKKPWDVQPYAKWTLPGMPIDGVTNLMRAGYYDPATRRLYVGSTDSMTVHVFEIANAVAQLPPNGPKALKAVAGAQGLTFTWAPPDGSGWSHYALEAGTSPGAWNVGVLPVSSGATSLTLAASGTGTFYVRLRAVYADGTDPSSNEVQVVLGAVGGAAPPTNFSATAAGSTVTLAWDPIVDPGVSDVIADVGNGPGLANLAQGASIGKAGSYVAANVPAGHYYLRARAVNAAGAGAPTNDVEVVVGGGPVPGSPLDLVASVRPDRSVELTWRIDPAGAPPTQLVLEAGSVGGLADLGTLPLPVGVRFEAPPVPPGAYYVRVRAANANGVSAPSNEVRIVVP